jgi:tetratricopeptide (TPR) repeat protein
VPAAVAAWAWRARLARPGVLAGFAVLVLAVSPVLGLTPFMFQYTTTVADHYLYFAMFGPALVLTWALVRYRHRALTGACAVALAVLAVRSNDQLAHWRNDLTLWTHGVAVAPGSFVGRTNLAAALSRRASELNTRADDLREAGKAAAADKLQADRRRLLERAVVYLEEAIAIQPRFMTARQNAWISYLFLGRHAKAAEHLEAQLAISETNPDPAGRAKLGPYYASAADMWMKAGRYDRAIADFEKALRIKPDNEEATKGIAEARAKVAEARVDLDKRE